MITDAAGVIKAESDYYPWGGELQFVANDSNHYKFTGKERDGETQLDYFGARYYSNGLGRWVSADWSPTPIPVPYADFGDPQSLNLYSYVRGLPTTRIDADGHVSGSDNGNLGYRGLPDDIRKQVDAIGRKSAEKWFAKNRKENASFNASVFKTAINTLIDLGNLGNQLACKLNPDCDSPKLLETLSPSNAEERQTMRQLGILLFFIPGGEEEGAAKATFLYARYSKEGEFLKWGITDNPLLRYTKKELAGGSLELITQGPRGQMERLERWLTERAPGPMNHEPWAGSKYSERSLRAVDRVLGRIWSGPN